MKVYCLFYEIGYDNKVLINIFKTFEGCKKRLQEITQYGGYRRVSKTHYRSKDHHLFIEKVTLC